MGLDVLVHTKASIETKFLPEVSDDVVADFNEGMAKIARHSKREDLMPLTFQVSATWEEAIPDERKTCLEKATSLTNSRSPSNGASISINFLTQPFPSRFINRPACFPRKVSYFRESRMSP